MFDDASIYVHFPWCVRKCPYCDFNSHPLKDTDDKSAYCDALIRDWHAQDAKSPQSPEFRTVFMGGGTPSLFAPELMQRVLQTLPLSPEAEITMEANPGTMEHADFGSYRMAGINRLSIGAQSFDDAQLKKLGRIHSADETVAAVMQARAGGFDNINLDLMWGLPGQNVDQAMADLEQALKLTPEHISWYQLTIEAKTEFARRPPLLPVDETLANIEQHGLTLLAEAGYQRYEVSAFARDDAQCRHNINYWTFGDYLGIGAGAHGKLSHIQGSDAAIVRSRKASQPRLYLGNPAQTEYADVANSERVVEFMLNALRLVDGVSFATFESRSGLEWSTVAPTWETLVDQQLVRSDRCATTARGLRYLDSVVASFLA